MGLFSKFKEIMDQNKETDITKMKFERFTGFTGSIPQNFCDTSFPYCPLCRQSKPWLVHVAHKTVKVFPITEEDNIYHIKCEKCGMVMHTTIRETNGNLPKSLTHPSPNDATTMVTIDVIGDFCNNTLLIKKTMSVSDINALKDSN